MHNIIPFIIKHWILCAALVLVIVMLAVEELKLRGRGGSQLLPVQAVQLLNHEKAVVLDVRDAQTFEQGHIVNALNIPQVDLENNAAKLNKYKDSALIVVCANGMKAAQIAQQLVKRGFTKAVALNGGLTAWKNANLPVVKG